MAAMGIAIVYMFIWPQKPRSRRSNELLQRLALLGYVMQVVFKAFVTDPSHLMELALMGLGIVLKALVLIVSRTLLADINTGVESLQDFGTRLGLIFLLSASFFWGLLDDANDDAQEDAK